jgi:hypothetical protein
MKSVVPVFLCLIALAPAAPADPEAALAWFTDADVPNSVRMDRPDDALPSAEGAVGLGVLLARAVPVDCAILIQAHGMIGFWIRPDWDGDDHKTHRILCIGDPETNGLLVEKSDLGLLRFVIASPERLSAARADVSHWKAGEWHHVVVVWMDFDAKPLGMPIWIDRKIAAGPTTADNDFLDPGAMDDSRIWIGDESSDAVMDELIVRNTLSTELSKGQIDIVYRDYLRTAPYSQIRIDPEPLCVPADRRVVEGQPKQFGLEGKLGDAFDDMTDFVALYHNWGHFDAKPLIRWSTSDPDIATVDENGLVTGGQVGTCTLTAQFRGMKAEYELEVIPIDRADLDLAWVERLPRYLRTKRKIHPDPGEIVQSVAHIFNMGYTPVPAGAEVTLELFPELNGNYAVDPDEERHPVTQTQRLGELAPEEEAVVTFNWEWPEEPVWVRVTVDPRDGIEEICEANNQRCDLNTARAMRWAYEPAEVDKFHDGREILLTGSFSVYDWDQSHISRVNNMLREAVFPSTSPHGVDYSIRLDANLWRGDYLAGDPWGPYKDREPVERYNEKWWDGGWPHDPIRFPLATEAAITHELGHTMLALPDLYGAPIDPNRTYLKDENGELYEGGQLLPYIARHKIISRPQVAGFVACGEGYASLMDACNMWIAEDNAVKINHYKDSYSWPFWGSQGPMVPTWRNWLYVTDVYDRPLVGAAVYIYQIQQNEIGCFATQYFYDRPKFVGNTDTEGRFLFPDKTDKDWDDPETDEFEGTMDVANPFGRALRVYAETQNCFGYDGIFLIKVVSGEQTEFHYLTLSQFMVAFAKNPAEGEYPIRTSLKPAMGTTPVVRAEIPAAIRKQNLRPVAVAEPTEITVKCGETYTLDGSKSYDPEGRELVVYAWHCREGDVKPYMSAGVEFKGEAPDKPQDMKVVMYVNDGLRVSEPVEVTVHVVDAGDQP